jgi:hypothetical protein
LACSNNVSDALHLIGERWGSVGVDEGNDRPCLMAPASFDASSKIACIASMRRRMCGGCRW